MSAPLLLDLFSCAGGAGTGYEWAGFHVIAVDIKPQKRNPHEFYQDDAIHVLDLLLAGKRWNGYRMRDFKVLTGSPPCQDYSQAKNIPGVKFTYPRLIMPVRDRMRKSGLPWVIENVRGALKEMDHPVKICGTSLGLRVQRHRLFDCSHILFSPGPCRHATGDVCVFGGGAGYIGTRGTAYLTKNGNMQYRRLNCRIADARKAMGISWMTFDELSEAIPPAYTEFLGKQLISIVTQ